MSKHTPGPWRASKFGFQVVTGDSWNTICALKGGAEWEDGRGKYEQEYEWQNQEANALLIAAAPCLLDALKATLNYIQNTENELGITLSSGDKARAALRKLLPESGKEFP